VPHVQARHQTATGRRTHSTGGASIHEAQTIRSEPVNIRRRNHLTAAATDIPNAEIIGKNENDVWQLRRCCLKHKATGKSNPHESFHNHISPSVTDSLMPNCDFTA
jgi:hypothetical protein